jgi:hypothetical protein
VSGKILCKLVSPELCAGVTGEQPHSNTDHDVRNLDWFLTRMSTPAMKSLMIAAALSSRALARRWQAGTISRSGTVQQTVVTSLCEVLVAGEDVGKTVEGECGLPGSVSGRR